MEIASWERFKLLIIIFTSLHFNQYIYWDDLSPEKIEPKKNEQKKIFSTKIHKFYWSTLNLGFVGTHDFFSFVIFFVAQLVALCEFYCVNEKVFMLLIKFIGIGSFIVAGCHRHKPRSHQKWCVHEMKSSYNLALHQRRGRIKQCSLHFSGVFDFRFKFASRR